MNNDSTSPTNSVSDIIIRKAEEVLRLSTQSSKYLTSSIKAENLELNKNSVDTKTTSKSLISTNTAEMSQGVSSDIQSTNEVANNDSISQTEDSTPKADALKIENAEATEAQVVLFGINPSIIQRVQTTTNVLDSSNTEIDTSTPIEQETNSKKVTSSNSFSVKSTKIDVSPTPNGLKIKGSSNHLTTHSPIEETTKSDSNTLLEQQTNLNETTYSSSYSINNTNLHVSATPNGFNIIVSSIKTITTTILLQTTTGFFKPPILKEILQENIINESIIPTTQNKATAYESIPIEDKIPHNNENIIPTTENKATAYESILSEDKIPQKCPDKIVIQINDEESIELHIKATSLLATNISILTLNGTYETTIIHDPSCVSTVAFMITTAPPSSKALKIQSDLSTTKSVLSVKEISSVTDRLENNNLKTTKSIQRGKYLVTSKSISAFNGTVSVLMTKVLTKTKQINRTRDTSRYRDININKTVLIDENIRLTEDDTSLNNTQSLNNGIIKAFFLSFYEI